MTKVEIASWARQFFITSPEKSQIDEEGLVWCPHPGGLWYSLMGNYSRYSPVEKRLKTLTAEEEAEQRFRGILAQSKIRAAVLERDEHTCQLCGKTGEGKLHVHHIMKRQEGGSDHFDNLITVCPSCHKLADGKLYNPDWL